VVTVTVTQKETLIELLYQLADDELVIGHRDSEWLGLAPHIEEDIAYASIAQDEIGHAAIFYTLLSELGEGSVDDLAFLRPANQRRNAVLLERPNGQGTYLDNPRFEWGYAVARRLAYDLFDALRLEGLAGSSYLPLAQVANKIRREERYHLLHQMTWFKRLASGSGEAREHLARGLERVWPDLPGLFDLSGAGGTPLLPVSEQEVLDLWVATLRPLFEQTGMRWPGTPDLKAPALVPDGRNGHHTPELGQLLSTMGEVYRTAPGATW